MRDLITNYSEEQVKYHNTSENCWIIIDKRIYNISSYIEEHPGGIDIILQYAGKDATDAYDEIGHSSIANNILNKYAIGTLNNTSIQLLRENINIKQIKKLFTKQDKIGKFFNIHKSLGIFCLFHYIYRFSTCIYDQIVYNNWDGRFDTSYKSLLLVWIHAVLSFSSLIFHVPNKQTKKPMIWKEFRTHNILFAMRSILCFTIYWLSLHFNLIKTHQLILQGLIVLITFKIADIITARMRIENSESTTRTLPYWENCNKLTVKSFKYYYMLSQFHATLACLNDTSLLLSFSVMFPIQFASLLMTLVRKGLITTKMYHISYLLSLILPYLLFFNLHSVQFNCRMGIFSFLIGNLLTLIRRQLHINKYLIWSIVIGIQFYNTYLQKYIQYI